MVLPGTTASKDVNKYASPSRAEDLFGLRPAFVAVGGGDPFIYEDVAFASTLGESGVNAELHVLPGALELIQSRYFRKSSPSSVLF